MRRSVIAASFGNALEWYDFSVYAFFAGYIAANRLGLAWARPRVSQTAASITRSA